MPHLPPGAAEIVAAGMGFISGITINYILNLLGGGGK